MSEASSSGMLDTSEMARASSSRVIGRRRRGSGSVDVSCATADGGGDDAR